MCASCPAPQVSVTSELLVLELLCMVTTALGLQAALDEMHRAHSPEHGETGERSWLSHGSTPPHLPPPFMKL